MIIAARPCNELDRLTALFEYELLDTEPEQDFDNLTQLAAQICDVPIALISLIDPYRQWFKSKVGIDVDETSREIAFCSHAILQDEIFEINDALSDPRFSDNPLVINAPHIRFYAGIPLKTPAGLNIGTLCVISPQPKALTLAQRQALTVLGKEVVTQCELRLKQRKLARATHFKDHFMATLSHQMRTPLQAIHQLSNRMSHHPLDGCKHCKATLHYIAEVASSGEQLLSMVDQSVTVAKLEHEAVNSVVAITDLLTHITARFLVEAVNKGIKPSVAIASDLPERVYTDRYKLERIFSCLIFKALKSTPRNETMAISAKYEADVLVLTINYTGMRFELTSLTDSIAHPGETSHPKTAAPHAVPVTTLIERMSGHLSYNNSHDCTITLMLPLRIVAAH